MKKLNLQCKKSDQIKTHWKHSFKMKPVHKNWIKNRLEWQNTMKQVWQTPKNGSSKLSYQLAMNFNWDIGMSFLT